jgi:hypothetical protein
MYGAEFSATAYQWNELKDARLLTEGIVVHHVRPLLDDGDRARLGRRWHKVGIVLRQPQAADLLLANSQEFDDALVHQGIDDTWNGTSMAQNMSILPTLSVSCNIPSPYV